MDKIKKSKFAYLCFVAPAFILFFTFFLIPAFQTLLNAFYYWDGDPTKTFAGLANFATLVKDKNLLMPLRNSLLWIIDSVFVVLPLSFIFALIIQSKVKGYRFFRTMFYLPAIISEMAIAIIWGFMFNTQTGAINAILTSIGAEGAIKGWLYDPKIAIFSCLFVNTWAYASAYMLIYLGEMKSIPGDIYEAAALDGATGWRKVRYITLPLMWDTIKVTVFLSICAGIQQFGLVFGLTGGGPGDSTQTLGTYMYNLAYRDQFYGYSSTVSLLILVISYAIITISNRLMKRSDDE